MLGIDDLAKALGLRPGEALQCIHADDEPSGCGTTKFCSTCGAAIAIVSSLKHNKSVERICALSSNRIFQRNFSTKEQAGRGIGTFSMKLFGEKILGGQIKFTTSKKGGTTFKFTHPV